MNRTVRDYSLSPRVELADVKHKEQCDGRVFVVPKIQEAFPECFYFFCVRKSHLSSGNERLRQSNNALEAWK